MRVHNCVALLSALVAVGTAAPDAVAAGGGDDNAKDEFGFNKPRVVDDADFDDDDPAEFSNISLRSLAKDYSGRQKREVEEGLAQVGDGMKAIPDDEDDDDVEESGFVMGGDVVDKELEAVEDPDDMEEDPEPPAPEPKEPKKAEPKEGSEVAAPADGEAKYAGLVLETRDEEGTAIDLGNLTPDDGYRPEITEFVEGVPTFQKEKDKKEKQKQEAKEKKKSINEISIYEKEREQFLEAKKRNEDRFFADVENVEKELEPPKSPGWWKRLKKRYSDAMDNLTEKFGSKEQH